MTEAESSLGADQAPVTGALHVVDPGLVNEGANNNRIIVSPMCQYSADDGHMTAWHKTHLQGFAVRGAGLVLTEVQAVVPEGRISPEDLGIWDDSHLGPAKEVIDFIHSQGGHIGIQIGHAGRKASTVAPWIDRKAVAGEKVRNNNSSNSNNSNNSNNIGRGWSDKVYGPSAVAYSKDTYVPKAMTLDDIDTFKAKWVDAVKRAVKVGYDTIEIHAAHGYLINNFLSPTSNTRTDRYGGSFENRTRLLVELTGLTRAHVPDDYPVLVRLAGTDYHLEFDASIPQWDIGQAQRLARILADKGADFLDVSDGGQDARMRVVPGPKYQAHLAAAVREAVRGTGALVGSVGGIASGRVRGRGRGLGGRAGGRRARRPRVPQGSQPGVDLG
ncbi:NADPH dehydrogenase afvA [Colletotrichum shisoi]|uniref:NADPH dehydrogenase afvA n=1 Tax=Colletotrichum shisoi TaxID=2078593 RepID=A0A5Q4BHR3_9PEZI|nr:NADPH dehydrogenase afvA [Colletotrichum shisoi]